MQSGRNKDSDIDLTFVNTQGLPRARVKFAVVSYRNKSVLEMLKTLGVDTAEAAFDQRLPKPVGDHADMIICHMQKNDVFLLRGNYKLGEILQNKGFNVFYTKNEPANIYPGDVILNCLLLNNKLYCSNSVDERIIDYANRRGIEICFVKQGYTACSCCVVDENSVITADNGLAAVLSRNGVDVLRIQPGYIELAGYDTGFIGGCSFKLSENKMLFTGKLSCHPSGNEIKSFLNKKGVEAIECDNENLVDIGSVAPLLTD